MSHHQIKASCGWRLDQISDRLKRDTGAATNPQVGKQAVLAVAMTALSPLLKQSPV